MSPSFLVKILCYTPLTNKLASPACILVGPCLILKSSDQTADDVSLLVRGVQRRILTRNDGHIKLIR